MSKRQVGRVSEAKDCGLYIHIPFCRTKCQYCSFNSCPCQGAPPQEYITAVVRQCEAFGALWPEPKRIGSLFIGGGTPTVYNAEMLAGLLASCGKIFSLAAQAEMTVESNPNTITREGLIALRRVGMNRLSIGVQSFDNTLLAVLGRSHSAEDARAAIGMAKEAGFANINIDLMYGLPGQTTDMLQDTLEQALALDVEHIALYELSIEEGTPFARRLERGTLVLPEESEVLAMEALLQSELPANGYERYEISNYAKPGYGCRHNINYWRNGEYIGVGAGAVSYIDGVRTKNIDSPDDYIARIASDLSICDFSECLSEEAAFRETVIMGLRMIGGVDLQCLQKRFELEPITYYGVTLEKLLADELLRIEGKYLQLTPKSLPVANQVLSALV